MKNRTFSKYIAIMLFITMLTLIAIAGTYAKYTSNFVGTGTATAADWKVTVNGEVPGESKFTLNSTNKIYPGATNIELGNITVSNGSSTVNAKVTKIEVKINNENLKDKIELTTGATTTSIAPGASATIPVSASWEYTNDNETDYNNTDITFDVIVTVDQVTN